MSYNTKIRTYSAPFAKHAAAILAATVGIAAFNVYFINMLSPNGIWAVISSLDVGLFFAILAYIPVYLMYDYLEMGDGSVRQRIALPAVTTIAAGATLWLAIIGLSISEYIFIGSQGGTLPPVEMFTQGAVVAVIFMVGGLCCLFFGAVRIPLALFRSRSTESDKPI